MQATYLTARGSKTILSTDHASSSHGQPVLIQGDRAYGPADLTESGRRATWHMAAIDGWSQAATQLRAAWEAQLVQHGLMPTTDELQPCPEYRRVRERELFDE